MTTDPHHVDHFRTLARYNQWMNTKVYSLCEPLTDIQRDHDAGAFFGSINGTLNHLLWGDRAWMNRLSDNTYEAHPINQRLHNTFAEMRAAREALDSDIIQWTDNLDAATLAAPYTWTSGLDKRERTQPTWFLVTHMFNHQTHHRGQLTTLLSQIGIDYGSTDLPFMPDAGQI